MKHLSKFLPLLLIIFLIAGCSKDDDNRNSNNGGGGSTSTGCSGGPSTVTDIDGNVYNVVSIGNQCWMKENLRTTRYSNGQGIPEYSYQSNWASAIEGAYCSINNDPQFDSIYGKVYNGFTVADPRGLCPVGWRVPSKDDWNELIYYVDAQADTSVVSGTISQIAGGMLKQTGDLQSGTGLWEAPNVGATNSSGFTAIPGGNRKEVGQPAGIGIASWWSSTEFISQWHFAYQIFDATIGKGGAYDRNGMQVRCIKN
jgi:uncharacterized protein (TIGR02145 family)